MEKKRSKAVEFLMGGAATMGATVFSNPLEVVKIRMQLQGELQKGVPRIYTGVFSGLWHIIKHDGLLAIQKGLAPGLVYQFFMNGTRLGTYSYLQPKFCDTRDPWYYWKNTMLASASGALGGAIGSPFFLIKTRLQSQSNIKVGYQHNYQGFMDAIVKIFKNEGISGFIKGTRAASLRVAIGSSAQLPSYDQAKILLHTHKGMEGVPLHIASSFISGLMVTTAMNPFDVISTRIYNESNSKGKGEQQYKGILDCAKKTIKAEGFFGLYKGWTAHFMRLAPHTILMFVFLEQLKRLHSKYSL